MSDQGSTSGKGTSRPSAPRDSAGQPSQDISLGPGAPLKLAMLDNELAAERRALMSQLEVVKAQCRDLPQELAPQVLLRLLVLLDHAAHLTRRCIEISEQRRALLLSHARD